MSRMSDLYTLNFSKENLNEYRKRFLKENFETQYSKKKYDKLNFDFIKKILKTKFELSISYLDLLKSKVLIEMFISIVFLFKQKNKNRFKKNHVKNHVIRFVKIKDLMNIGFSKSSIKSALKKLIKLGLIDEEIYKKFKAIKPLKNDLKTKGEIYIVFDNQIDWKILFLYGWKTVYIYKICKYQSSKINNKNKEVLFHNKLFKFNRFVVYLSLKKICNFLNLKYKNVFRISKTLKNENNEILSKIFEKNIWNFKFISLRYLTLKI